MSDDFEYLKNISAVDTSVRREKAVRAAVTLLNTRLATEQSHHAISDILNDDVISKIADKIESALQKT